MTSRDAEVVFIPPPPELVLYARGLAARKQRLLDQVNAYVTDTAGDGGVTLSYADVKAMATGDPKLLRAVTNQAEVRRLLRLRQPAYAASLDLAVRAVDTAMAAPGAARK